MTIKLIEMVRAIPVVALGLTFAGAGEVKAEVSLSCGGDASAGPYYDPCSEIEGWSTLSVLSSGAIPEDGVLVLQGEYSGAQPELSTISLTVTTDDDTAIAGKIEASAVQGVLIWRPDAAWPAGASITIDGAVDNPGGDGACVPFQIFLDGEVTIEDDGGAPLVPVILSGQATVEQSPTVSLETLACCEGVTPTLYEAGCGGPAQVNFDPEQCAPFVATGYMSLALSGTPAASGAAAGQVAYVFKPDGLAEVASLWPESFGLDGLQAPQCAAIDAIDLRSGAVVAGAKECFGESVKDQLGPQVLDPAATLMCALQVCEVAADGWDLEKCTPYGGGGGETPTSGGEAGSSDESGGDAGGQDSEKGCSCDSTGSGAPGLLVLVGLVGLARRRRV